MSNTSNWVESGPVTIQTVRKNYHHGDQLAAFPVNAVKRGSSRKGSEVELPPGRAIRNYHICPTSV